MTDTAPPPTTPAPKLSSKLIPILLWLLILAPALICGALMRENGTNQRFLDDWVWGVDLVKMKTGTFTLHDVFSVHLEHRPALAKTLALIVTLTAKGDVLAQNVLTYLFLLGTYAALLRLWMKRGGLTLASAWPPMLLASLILFTPVQWQTLLWPICCETVMPVFFLLLAFLIAFKSWPWWLRALAGTACAVAGMLSFASGLLLWFLPLPVMLLCGAFKSNRQRLYFTGLWSVILVITMLVYAQVKIVKPEEVTKQRKAILTLTSNAVLTYDIHNEVPPQFAYSQGNEDTVGGELKYFLQHPALDLQFVSVFSGAVIARGWATDLKTSTERVGDAFLLLLLGCAVYAWIHRKDEALRVKLLPMFCLALYTPATGLMVAVGRIYAGGTGTALNVRYHCHQTQLVVGLIGLIYFIGSHLWERSKEPQQRVISSTGFAVGGLLFGVLFIGWIFGASMMAEWREMRLRDAAAQWLSQIKAPTDKEPKYSKFVSRISGNYLMTRDVTNDLDGQGLLTYPPLRENKLSLVRKTKVTLGSEHADFTRLFRDPNGSLRAEGYTYLPKTRRPANAILFAYHDTDGEWRIFAYTQALGLPRYLPRSTMKDLQFIVPRRDPFPNSLIYGWDDYPTVIVDPPAGARIQAWAVDATKMVASQIVRYPKGDDRNENGETLEELTLPVPDPLQKKGSKKDEAIETGSAEKPE